MAIENVVFKYGSQAAYEGLAVKDANTIYWLTDVGKIFRGAVDFSKSTEVLSVLPAVADGKQGIIYVILGAGDPSLYVFNGTVFVPLTKVNVTTISAASTDAQVPTAKAVYDFVITKTDEIDEKISDLLAGDLDLDGYVKDPTYDAEYRKIILPINGGTDLEINLGKDLVVTSGVYNKTSKEIELTTTDGSVVKVPVGDLIPVFNFIDTNTMQVVANYNTTTKETDVTIQLKVSATEGNAAEVKSDGLFIGALKWEPIA